MLSKIFDIQLNTKHQESQATDILVNQGDTNSVVFNFHVYKGADEINYDDVSSALLVVSKPDRHTVQQAATTVEGGGFTAMLSQQALAAVGVAMCFLVLYGHKGERISTLRFTFGIESDLMPWEMIESSTEFDALQKAVAMFDKLVALYDNWLPIDHAAMNNLGFTESGHTGFASQSGLEAEIEAVKAAIDIAIETIPQSGLRIPIKIELESNLPNAETLTADDVGLHWEIQDMDITASGRNGRAWVNFENNDPENPIVIYRVYNQRYSADDESIILTPARKLSVSSDWLADKLIPFDDHINDKNNPHGTTAAQTGAANFNILHNADFRNPVNQRGQDVYTTTGYTVDRWLVWSTASQPRTEVSNGFLSFINTANGIQVWEQRFEFPAQLVGMQLTLSVELLNGEIRYSTFDNTGNSRIALGTSGSVDMTGNAVRILPAPLQTISIRCIKLEPGTVSTLANDPPVDFGRELAICQRFQQRIELSDNQDFGSVIAHGSTVVFATIPMIVQQMRSNHPSLTHGGTLALVSGTTTINITSIALIRVSSGTIPQFSFNTSGGLTPGTAYRLMFLRPAGFIMLDANL